MEGLVTSHDPESYASSSSLHVKAHFPDRSKKRSQTKKQSTIWVKYVATSYTQEDAHIKVAKDQTTHSITYMPCPTSGPFAGSVLGGSR
jgi:hypothetical protein